MSLHLQAQQRGIEEYTPLSGDLVMVGSSTTCDVQIDDLPPSAFSMDHSPSEGWVVTALDGSLSYNSAEFAPGESFPIDEMQPFYLGDVEFQLVHRVEKTVSDAPEPVEEEEDEQPEIEAESAEDSDQEKPKGLSASTQVSIFVFLLGIAAGTVSIFDVWSGGRGESQPEERAISLTSVLEDLGKVDSEYEIAGVTRDDIVHSVQAIQLSLDRGRKLDAQAELNRLRNHLLETLPHGDDGAMLMTGAPPPAKASDPIEKKLLQVVMELVHQTQLSRSK